MGQQQSFMPEIFASSKLGRYDTRYILRPQQTWQFCALELSRCWLVKPSSPRSVTCGYIKGGWFIHPSWLKCTRDPPFPSPPHGSHGVNSNRSTKVPLGNVALKRHWMVGMAQCRRAGLRHRGGHYLVTTPVTADDPPFPSRRYLPQLGSL